MSVGFKTDAIDCAIDLGGAKDLIDLICYGSLKRNVNGFATEGASLLETILDSNRRR